MTQTYNVYEDSTGDFVKVIVVELQKNGFPPRYTLVDNHWAERVKTDSGHKYLVHPKKGKI